MNMITRWRNSSVHSLVVLGASIAFTGEPLLLSGSEVTAREEVITLPTYLPAAADRNPRFYNGRTYQGARATFILKNETHHWLAPNEGHEMAKVIANSGASFVEGAILGAVGVTGARTHILLGGERARAAAEIAAALVTISAHRRILPLIIWVFILASSILLGLLVS